MALLTEQREPEMARFIDTYKFEQDKATRRDRFGGGTSLPLDSDGYEDKQRVLREERHKDWLQQQDKPRDPVYYRVGTPEEGFLGLGEYEKRRHEMNVIRQKEYNDLLRKQREMEHQKLEARRHQSPPRPAQPPGAQLDYHIQSEKARAEEKRAYQDYMKAKEERYWAMRGRPVTPPGGLNIGNYDRQVKETAAQKKKEYKEMLDQQQREHMYLRARQEPEVPVLDRNAQPSNYLANKPPPGPGYTRARDEAEDRRRQDDMKHQQQQSSKPAEVVKNPFYSSDDYEKFQREIQRKQAEDYKDFLAKSFQPPSGRVGLPLGQYKYEPKRLLLEAERNTQWNEYVRETSKHMQPKAIDGPQGLNIDVSYQTRKQAWLEKQRNKDYNEFLKKRTIRQKAPTPPDQQGLPIGQQHYEPMHKAMEQQRNKEYNEFLQKKYGNKNLRTTRSEPDRPNANEDKASFYYGSDKAQDEKRKMLEEERKNEYNQFIKELDPPPSKSMEIPTDVESGLPIGQQHHEAWRKFLRAQRNKEYNQFVDAKNAEVKHRDWNYEQNGILELRGDDAVQSKQRELRAERQRDYNNYMSQQRVSNPSRRHEFVDTASGPYGGLFHGLGEHGNRSDVLNKERQQEYNDLLTQQYGKDRPSGRPNWVKESIPNDKDRGRSPMRNPPPTDHYQQMLDEKRREEANRRRYDDPEYQGRLGQGRDRGEAGQRLGY